MIISHKLKLIFIHVPRTGGTATSAALAPFMEFGDTCRYPKDAEEAKRMKGWHRYFYHRAIMHDDVDSEVFTSMQPLDYFSFTFIRNPWDRTMSLWKGRRQTHPKVTLKEYIEYLPQHKNPAYHDLSRTQLSWVKNKEGKLVVDFVGKTENLEADLNRVVAPAVGIKEHIQTHMHNLDNDRRTRFQVYNAETIKMVADRFAEDVEYGQYTFED